MNDFSSTFSINLTCNCPCFKNEVNFPTQKAPRKLADYITQTKQKCNAMCKEVQKHLYFDIEEMKPCYGVSTTTALVLRSSIFRHLKSIKRLKTVGKKNSGNVYIKFPNGKELTVDVYTQTVKQLLETNINTLTNFSDVSSPVEVHKLQKSEEQHLSTLKVLQHVVKNVSDGFDQLEIFIESPE